MKSRHVYTTQSISAARECVAEARQAGVTDADIAIIADAKTQLENVPDRLKDDASTDVVPAAMRGAIGGGGAGLLAGLAATSIPTAGVTLAGAGILGIAGAALGTWSSALVGASVPNAVQRQFEERIEAGEVLIAVDVEDEVAATLDPRLTGRGAEKLDYAAATALS